MSSGLLTGMRDAFTLMFRDRAVVSTMIGAAVLYSFFYPTPYRRQIRSQTPVAIVDLDRSPMSRGLVRNVLAVQGVRIAASVDSLDAAEALMADGTARAIMIVTRDFERQILRGEQGRVALFGNGVLLGDASNAFAGLADAIAATARQAAVAQATFAGAPAAPPFELVQRPLFNTREGYASTVVPAVAVIIVHQTVLLGIGILAGTLRERYRTLTVARPRLFGIALAFCVIATTSLLYYAGFVFWFQDYPRGGNGVGLIVAGGLFVASVVALGLFVGSYFDARERALQTIVVLSIPMFFLANVSWPATSTPAALLWLAKLLPTTAGINAMIKFNQMGARLGEARPELINLAVLVVLYGSLTLVRYRSHP
jgi:ABC-2 type transport system permease protein